VLARLGLPAAPLVLRSPLARRIAFRDVMEHGERVDAADAVRDRPRRHLLVALHNWTL
jgi:hypothetical protein